ncbi:MAG: hypothetical protein J6S67_01315 [Methanobrevibacter sp.]|nr:hypothetical protein [Methanobrevibacter sp.]
MQNPKTFFEQWLSETLDNDPHYAFNIVCNYYDDCVPCPLRPLGCYTCSPTLAMDKLESTTEGDNEDDN